MAHSAYSAPLDEYLEVEARKLDASTVESKATQLHRLFDNAKNSLLALMIFAKRNNVGLHQANILEMSVDLLLTNVDGKRSVEIHWNGHSTTVDVDRLDTALDATILARMELAAEYGVPEQVLLRYEKQLVKHQGQGLGIPCNHHGCAMVKSLFYRNPLEMIEAERRANTEIWYCHNHRQNAFEKESAISDELLMILDKIGTTPGLSQKDTGAKREDIMFLEGNGLVNVEKVTQRDRLLCYRINLTEGGEKIIRGLLGK